MFTFSELFSRREIATHKQLCSEFSSDSEVGEVGVDEKMVRYDCGKVRSESRLGFLDIRFRILLLGYLRAGCQLKPIKPFKPIF